MKIKASSLYWTTNNGEKLRVTDMQSSHIQNCIKMLQRTIATRPNEYAWGEPDGDMALDAFNSGIRHNDSIEQDMKNQIIVFEKVLEHRGE